MTTSHKVDEISQMLKEVRRLLPVQNPLSQFLHNNMLLAYESQPFWQGVQAAARLYEAAPTWPLARYQAAAREGRIDLESLEMAVADHLSGQSLWLGRSAAELSLESKRLAELLWYSPQASADLVTRAPPREFFPRPALEWLTHLAETYLDQGAAPWFRGHENIGLLAFVQRWARYTKVWSGPWQQKLAARVVVVAADPAAYLLAMKQQRSLSVEAWTELCLQLAFTLKGWSGMMHRLETHADLGHLHARPVQLVEWLALLVLVAEVNGLDLVPVALPMQDWPIVDGLSAQSLAMIWHEAYENAAYRSALATLSMSRSMMSQDKAKVAPRFMVLCCMDDREESLRRHLEAQSPECVTYGVLGHFHLDMRFRAQGQSALSRQCPPVVEPRRTLLEAPSKNKGKRWRRPLSTRLVMHWYRRQGLSQFVSALETIILGPLAWIPLLLKALVPQSYARRQIAAAAAKRQATIGEISLERYTDPELGECGYSTLEQTEIVSSLLRQASVEGPWPALVLVLAHEASSANNPFAMAYGCGACSGNSGAVNARLFAAMANAPEVRACLAQDGLLIPAATRFVAAVHDTTADTVAYFANESASWSAAQQNDWRDILPIVESALADNAVERCRSFANSAPQNGLVKCRNHVLQRSASLAEPRPEYGHARVGFAVIGRRPVTKHAFLDRRSFLLSYEAGKDVDGEKLKALVHGAVPVVANISLDYLFSSLDPHSFGAGSKLPLNISALLGVISGSRGDLRVGLTAQMTEIHEPMRALVCIEADEAEVLAALQSHRRLNQLLKNGWMRIAAMQPQTGAISLWDGVRFRPWIAAGGGAPALKQTPEKAWLQHGLQRLGVFDDAMPLREVRL